MGIMMEMDNSTFGTTLPVFFVISRVSFFYRPNQFILAT